MDLFSIKQALPAPQRHHEARRPHERIRLRDGRPASYLILISLAPERTPRCRIRTETETEAFSN